ncbi:MAG: alpha/beta hydrolase [Sphingopyxis sp.]
MTAESAPFDRRAFPVDAQTTMRPAADGWPLRSIIWPAPQGAVRGSLLFLGGRGDHFEKYLESFADWHARGWQVESVDWRGQGGSGRLSSDPHVGHCHSFAQWIDDIAEYAAAWTARTAGPHVIIAHSMGGHLLLRALSDRRIVPDAAVLVAPMLGFTAPYPDGVGHWIARTMCRIGDPARAAWKVSEKPGSKISLRQMLLTHDNDRYADELWWRAKDPSLELGPASWRWVEQAYASFAQLGQPEALESVATPVLVLVASADKLVSPSAARRLAARLPHGETHVYGREAAHELLREVDAVRDDVLARIDAFLDKEAPKT